MIRQHFIFSGRVQGVGFRYKAYYTAQKLGVTGWVKNLWNGTVEMEAQGDEAAIDRMLVLLQEDRWIDIDQIDRRKISVQGHENSFWIK